MDQEGAHENTRVSDSAIRKGRGFDSPWLWVTYDLGGWFVTLKAQPTNQFDGPMEMTVRLDMSDEGVDDALGHAETGLTAEVLRSVPLGDARKVLRRLRSDVLASRDKESYDLPARMSSPEDWAKFARAYARSAVSNPHQPTAHLARATGLSVNTLTARLRRVQELGLLVPSGSEVAGEPWLLMSDKAHALLTGKRIART